jgi:hypothetical protein
VKSLTVTATLPESVGTTGLWPVAGLLVGEGMVRTATVPASVPSDRQRTPALLSSRAKNQRVSPMTLR